MARADAAELKVLDLEAYVSILRDNMAVQRKKAQEDGYESQLTDMGLRLEAVSWLCHDQSMCMVAMCL